MKIFVVGSINMDLVVNAPFMPENGMTITGSNFFQNPGGKGANQAVACSKLGADAYMVGAVGNAFGNELINTLNGYGVKTNYVKQLDNVSSGVAVIVVVDHDNRIILDAGSNALVSHQMIDEALKNADAGDYLICQLEIPQEEVLYAFKKAKEKGMITLLNPAPAAKLLNGILPLTDIFVPNQSECEVYTGIYPKDETSVKSAFNKLTSLGVKQSIITLGLDGSATIQNGKYLHVDAHKVNAVDTTAAGDTYIGALVTALSEGKDLKEAMEFASLASSITVTKPGAQQAIPYRKEVEEKN